MSGSDRHSSPDTKSTGGTSKKVFQRKKHKNSRLGCPQCKQRRVKCDETLPSCTKCQGRLIRCGYLDYSPREIELILLAHWEAEGSDPNKMPFAPQQLQNPYVNALQDGTSQQQQPLYSESKSSFPPQPSLFQQQYMPIAYNYQELHPHPEFTIQQQQQSVYFLQQSNLVSPYIQPLPTQNRYIEEASSYRSISEQGTSVGLNQEFDSSGLSISSASTQGQYIQEYAVSQRQPTDQSTIEAYVKEKIVFTDDNRSPSPNPENLVHPIDQMAQLHADSTETTPGSFDSPPKSAATPSTEVDVQRQARIRRNTHDLEVELIPHRLNEPQFDLQKYQEFFGETIANVFARIFLWKEIHSRLVRSTTDPNCFKALMVQGLGALLPIIPNLAVFFLRYRGSIMSFVLKELSNVNDSNADLLLILTSILNNSSVFLKDQITLKDYFLLATGPGALLKEAFKDPSKFPNSFIKLKNHADGLLFTARYVWIPHYDHKALYEFLEVVEQFGAEYIENEDFVNDDDVMVEQHKSLVKFIKYCINFLDNEKSSREVLRYPIKRLFKLMQRWYRIFPSECFTLGSKTPPIEKTFYLFWFALIELLEVVLVGCRYVFIFFLDGYYLMHTYDKDAILEGVTDEKLIFYINYSSRMIAFLNRRRAYIMRNTILNDPYPKYLDSDRFKARAIDIRERCITSFKDTIIKKFHYPMESGKSYNQVTNSPDVNYYKKPNTDLDQVAEELATGVSYNQSDGNDGPIDLVHGINPKTSLHNDDYDPRPIDPIFNDRVVFASADEAFLEKYIEDIRLITQMGDADPDSDYSENELGN